MYTPTVPRGITESSTLKISTSLTKKRNVRPSTHTPKRFDDGKLAEVGKLTIDRNDVSCDMNLSDMKKAGVKELILVLTNLSADNALTYHILGS